MRNGPAGGIRNRWAGDPCVDANRTMVRAAGHEQDGPTPAEVPMRSLLLVTSILVLVGCSSDDAGAGGGADLDAGSGEDAGLRADAGVGADAGVPPGSVALGGACGGRADCVPGARCESGVCQAFQPGEFCEPCSMGPNAKRCDDSDVAPSHCLVDAAAMEPGRFFCGAGCEADADCASGASCSDVTILTFASCTASTACVSEKACANDADCLGGTCADGLCRPPCVIGDGDAVGFCGCATDGDCPKDFCDLSTSRCAQTGAACDPADADPCPAIACVRSDDGFGYCRVGRSCAPAGDLTCAAFR